MTTDRRRRAGLLRSRGRERAALSRAGTHYLRVVENVLLAVLRPLKLLMRATTVVGCGTEARPIAVRAQLLDGSAPRRAEDHPADLWFLQIAHGRAATTPRALEPAGLYDVAGVERLLWVEESLSQRTRTLRRLKINAPPYLCMCARRTDARTSVARACSCENASFLMLRPPPSSSVGRCGRGARGAPRSRQRHRRQRDPGASDRTARGAAAPRRSRGRRTAAARWVCACSTLSNSETRERRLQHGPSASSRSSGSAASVSLRTAASARTSDVVERAGAVDGATRTLLFRLPRPRTATARSALRLPLRPRQLPCRRRSVSTVTTVPAAARRVMRGSSLGWKADRRRQSQREARAARGVETCRGLPQVPDLEWFSSGCAPMSFRGRRPQTLPTSRERGASMSQSLKSVGVITLFVEAPAVAGVDPVRSRCRPSTRTRNSAC